MKWRALTQGETSTIQFRYDDFRTTVNLRDENDAEKTALEFAVCTLDDVFLCGHRSLRFTIAAPNLHKLPQFESITHK